MMDHCFQSKGLTDLTIPNWTWWSRIFCITSSPTSLTSGQRTDCVSDKQTLLLIGNVVTREETFLREDSDAHCRWKWYYFVFLINSWFMSHILVSGRVQKYYTRLNIRQNWNHVTYHAGSHNISLTQVRALSSTLIQSPVHSPTTQTVRAFIGNSLYSHVYCMPVNNLSF